MNREALIIDAVRIPRARAKKDGTLAHLKPVHLLKPLYDALVQRNPLPIDQVDDIVLGCVTQVGEQGANLARISALFADWDASVSGMTVSRFCSSGLDAVNVAAGKIAAGFEDLVVAGGVESLSRVPMFSDKGSWFTDPEVARKTRFIHMGIAADLLATLRGYNRDQLDTLGVASHQRALEAQQQGYFQRSLIPIYQDDELLLDRDEGPRPQASLEQWAALPPSFEKLAESTVVSVIGEAYPDTTLTHHHTVGTSPAVVDGASLVLMSSPEKAAELGLQPRARIRAFADAGAEPVVMLTGHIRATEKMLNRTGLQAADIDLWEINESFAASVLAFQETFDLDPETVNVNGSAIAMGHPLGATGGNLLATLLDELERRNLARGCIAIPGGAGVGVACLIERTR